MDKGVDICPPNENGRGIKTIDPSQMIYFYAVLQRGYVILKKKIRVKLCIFSNPSVLTLVAGAQKNHLI